MNPKLTLIADKEWGHVLAAVTAVGAPDPLGVGDLVSDAGLSLRFCGATAPSAHPLPPRPPGSPHAPPVPPLTASPAPALEMGVHLQESDIRELLLSPKELALCAVDLASNQKVLRAPRSYVVAQSAPVFRSPPTQVMLTTTHLKFTMQSGALPEEARYCLCRTDEAHEALSPVSADVLAISGQNGSIRLNPTLELNSSYLILLLLDGCCAYLGETVVNGSASSGA
jgi:hypothetical protein